MICQLCHQLHPPSAIRFFCPDCQERIQEKGFVGGAIWRQAGSMQVLRLFPYKGWIRKQCLKVKTKNDLASMRGLIELIRMHPAIALAMTDIDVVTVVPSSIWSRLRGRIDFAGVIAETLAREYSKFFVVLPKERYYWRFIKSALQKKLSHQTFTQNKTSSFDTKTRALKVLLIDDIITTGNTLAEVSQYISGPISYMACFDAGKC